MEIQEKEQPIVFTNQRVMERSGELKYSKASVNTISANTIFEITWFWLLSQIFQFYTISPQKPLNKDKNADILCTPGSTGFIIWLLQSE